MIRKLGIQNFMSLRDVTVELEPLTVFVGRNATGKSAIFKALVTVSKLLGGVPLRGPGGDFALEDGITLDDLVWSGNSGLPIRFEIWLQDNGDGGTPNYTLELTKRAEGWSVSKETLRLNDSVISIDDHTPFVYPTERAERTWKPPLRATLRYLVHPHANDSAARPSIKPILQLSEAIGRTWRYRPSASDIAAFVKPFTDQERQPFVQENGRGVASILQTLQGEDRQTFTLIETELCRLFPHIETRVKSRFSHQISFGAA